MKRLGLDLDGVLYNWHNAVYTELQIYEDLDVDFHEFWSSIYTTYKTKKFWEYLVNLRHLYGNQVPSKELVEMVQNIGRRYSIYYITNRPVQVADTTRNWLNRYKFPYVRNLIFTKDKPAVCNSVDIHLMVEDRVHNVIELLDADINTIVIRQPYNEFALPDLSKRCVVLNSVLQLKEIL